MIKMIVSSFYNTLINKEEAISTDTMLEIERLRKKKIIFVVATNRMYKDVLEYNKDFPFIDYIISLNGSCLYDVIKGKEIYLKKISISNINKISKIVKDNKIDYYTSDNIYHTTEEINNKNIYKIEIEIKDEQEEKKMIEEIKKLKVNTSFFFKNGKKYLEVTSYQSNMFTGADQIALKNNISLKEIITIGANESDLSLIQNIKNSYIMANSDSILKKVTKKRTKSNEEDGVKEILSKL